MGGGDDWIGEEQCYREAIANARIAQRAVDNFLMEVTLLMEGSFNILYSIIWHLCNVIQP